MIQYNHVNIVGVNNTEYLILSPDEMVIRYTSVIKKSLKFRTRG